MFNITLNSWPQEGARKPLHLKCVLVSGGRLEVRSQQP